MELGRTGESGVHLGRLGWNLEITGDVGNNWGDLAGTGEAC